MTFPVKRRRIAVIGSGISGASAAWALNDAHDVTLFEADGRLGGHTATVEIDYEGTPVAVDTGFIVYNELNYPNLKALFRHLDVRTHASEMSFALSLDGGKLEWSGQNYASLFAQRRNLVSLSFYGMLREVLRFNGQCLVDRSAGELTDRSIGEYIAFRKFSARFRDDYLIPMGAAIWSTPRAKMLDFPAESFVNFFENHRLIHNERPVWRTVTGGSKQYHDKLLAPLQGKVRAGCAVRGVLRDANGVTISTLDGKSAQFDHVIIASHSDQALAMLKDASEPERAVLSAIKYRPNRVILHRDASLMPKRKRAWAAWNYLRSSSGGGEPEIAMTYWMNRLQGIDASKPLFVTLNPDREPKAGTVFGEWEYAHPQFDAAAMAGQKQLSTIQGGNSTLFAGAWTGFGFHEDGLRSGLQAAQSLGASIPWQVSQAAPLMMEAAS
jgi:uncharacterized protein